MEQFSGVKERYPLMAREDRRLKDRAETGYPLRKLIIFRVKATFWWVFIRPIEESRDRTSRASNRDRGD